MTKSTSNIYEAVFGEASGSRNNASAVAAVDLGKSDDPITYAQLQSHVDGLRVTSAIEAGEKVALVMPNSLELVVGLFATWAQGAATAPLNPSYTAIELRDLFADLGITKALVLADDDKVKDLLRKASKDLKIIEVNVSGASSNQEQAPPVNNDNSIALYLHTSGTTGKPKAVPLRHSNLLSGASNVAQTYALEPKDRTYLLQVLFHIHGIVAALLAPLSTGGSIVIPPNGKLDASRAWTDFRENGCTWVTGTPSILQTLLAAPRPDGKSEIRFIRSCSSPLLPTVFNALRKRFDCPVIEAYAMTEASHQMCSNRLDLFASGTVGPEAGNAKICIWDGGNEACPLGVEGEVSVSGENVMGGYEGVSPEKNEEAFWRGVDERGNEATWFRTGDRGVLSPDGHRRLTLIGRLSEMVNRGGEKISPVEVDEAIMLASDDVKEAASFSVPDEFYGQEIEAAVVLSQGSELDEAALQNLLEERLAKFKIPKRIHFCEGKIPKGPTGKIQRKNLTTQFGVDSHNRQTNGRPADADIYDLIDRALNLRSGQSSKQPKATLLELGADSLGLAKIVSSAKRSLGRQLDMATLFSFPSVETVVNMAREGTANQTAQDGDYPKPAAFSLLPGGSQNLESTCRQAGIQVSDVENALPFSANQKAYCDIFLGDQKNTELIWQMNRYKISEGTDLERLVGALEALQRHEESLRWVYAEDPKGGLMILQLRPGVRSCVERLRCDSEQEATKVMDSRLASCRHQAGVRTATIYLIEIGQELEMTFIESHFFTEGQGRTQIFEVLNQAYNDEPLESYASYSSFTERFPVGHDSEVDMEFWRKDISAAEFSEGSDWDVKRKLLENPVEFANDRLDALGMERSVEAPFSKLTVQVGQTIPFVVEAVYALSLALYFSQLNDVFMRGSVVYDRCVSSRTAEPRFSSVRAVTGAYHPNFISLDLAKSSLWAHFQYFRGITQLREPKTCVNNTVNLANHAAAFTWRFVDDGDNQASAAEGSRKELVAGIKDERAAICAFKMFYVNANRKGENGVHVGVGMHQKWIKEQRQRGCKIELIDIFCEALKFCADNNASLQKLSLLDLQQAVLR